MHNHRDLEKGTETQKRGQATFLTSFFGLRVVASANSAVRKVACPLLPFYFSHGIFGRYFSTLLKLVKALNCCSRQFKPEGPGGKEGEMDTGSFRLQR